MNIDTDIAITGSGFSGSLLAMIARRLGYSVTLIERGKHPRFAIGESSTPLANLLIEELAARYNLAEAEALSEWGKWQDRHPKIGCGLKRGFSFYHHEQGRPFEDDGQHRRQLLVAASPSDAVADTHWYRADVDSFLASEAARSGAELLEETHLDRVQFDPGGAVLEGRRCGVPITVRAQFVFDATGPRGFLHTALGLAEARLDNLPSTQAVFSHFEGVRRWDELFEFGAPPYPVDDAALHHVFDDGWIWVLRFNNGITSAGAAATDAAAARYGFSEREAGWTRLLEELPSVQAQFAEAKAVMPFVFMPQVGFLSAQVAGERWALLPSAAGFVDPLLSTGFALTLLGLRRLGRALEAGLGSAEFANRIVDYSARTISELNTTARLVGALYATMNDFEVFRALTLLYFAAASYTETVRRRGKPELAGEAFLLGEHPEFAPGFERCVARALTPLNAESKASLIDEIYRIIRPVNVAGLDRADRRFWFPMDPEQLG